jgi:hypothetical protein
MFSNIVIVYLQVSEVRLFGEEDVTQDLFITFCQWQDDSSKVLVLGQRYYQIRMNMLYSILVINHTGSYICLTINETIAPHWV